MVAPPRCPRPIDHGPEPQLEPIVVVLQGKATVRIGLQRLVPCWASILHLFCFPCAQYCFWEWIVLGFVQHSRRECFVIDFFAKQPRHGTKT